MCYSIKVQQELDALWRKLGALLVKEAYERYEQMSLLDSVKYKPLITNARIFPYYFASVVYRDREGNTKMEPMRYQAWPPSYKEDPHQLTLYNARIDNLRSKTWSELFMVHHGVLVAHKFYEWVQVKDLLEKPENGVSITDVEVELLRRQEMRKERVLATGKPFKLTATEKLPVLERKITVAFTPKSIEQELILPVIFAERKQSDGSTFKSFAVVTTDPPPIVRSAGHDRCPIAFTSEKDMITYLEPWETNAGAIEELLHSQKPPALSFSVDKDL